MLNLIVKGFGGQGAKTFVEILASAANYENQYFLSYPEFGPERKGTPINAYFKMDSHVIRSRNSIQTADIIIVLDEQLQNYERSLKKKTGQLLLNCTLSKKYDFLDANKIAMNVFKKPIINTIMLGFLIKKSKILKKESVEKAIRDFFSGDVLKLNLCAFNEGYNC